MITPLDYRAFTPTPIMTLAFYTHFGIAMDRAQATFSEDCRCTSSSSYSSPVADWHSGCDAGYADEGDGTFDVPFAIRIDRPNRRFSP